MALRARLTLFYTSILGVVLALFGSAVYVLVSVVLIRQVDETLESAINDVLRLTMVDPQGQLFSTSELSLNENIVIQAWDTRGSSIGSTESFNPLSSLIFPLDPEGLKVSEPTFSEVQIGDSHLRVLSVPVVFEDEALGTFQAGTNLKPVDNVRTNLLQALLALGFLGLSVSALAGWLSTGRALAPLATMTRTALQITRADDLSRRIPQDNLVEDEVGLLVQAFNQTLGRMENLFESQRRFIADVGHELRTPLTVMKGNVDLLRRMPEQSEESLRSIEGEVDRLTRLVEDLLLLVYADTGKLPLNSTPLELDTLLLEIYQQARVLAGEKATVRIGEIDQVLVYGDRDRLKQVLLNLIANAVNHTPTGGEIEIALGKAEGQAYLLVRDNGPGISSEDLPHIFKRFYRGEKARRRSQDGKGFGLGLSIANWIIKNHDGKIEVETAPGRGTTFCVWLPLLPEISAPTPPAQSPDAAAPVGKGSLPH